MLMMPALSQRAFAQEAAAQPAAQAPTKTTFDADTVVWIFAVNPGKDAEYEQVIAKLKESLGKSTAADAKQQASGWTVTKSTKPLTNDGSSTYIHVISPVVKGADYSIVNIVYSASTDEEKRAFYELDRGSLKGPLSLMLSNTVSKIGQ